MRIKFNRSIATLVSGLLCIGLLAASCSTSDAPQPDLAAIVAGTYRVTTISTTSTGTVTLPSTSNERVAINRKGKNLIDIVNQFSTGTSTVDGVSLTGSTTNITFTQTRSTGTISGSFSGGQMNYSIVITTGDNATVTAVKI